MRCSEAMLYLVCALSKGNSSKHTFGSSAVAKEATDIPAHQKQLLWSAKDSGLACCGCTNANVKRLLSRRKQLGETHECCLACGLIPPRNGLKLQLAVVFGYQVASRVMNVQNPLLFGAVSLVEGRTVW